MRSPLLLLMLLDLDAAAAALRKMLSLAWDSRNNNFCSRRRTVAATAALSDAALVKSARASSDEWQNFHITLYILVSVCDALAKSSPPLVSTNLVHGIMTMRIR